MGVCAPLLRFHFTRHSLKLATDVKSFITVVKYERGEVSGQDMNFTLACLLNQYIDAINHTPATRCRQIYSL